MKEIERKFLVDEREFERFAGIRRRLRIAQGYLPSEIGERRIRMVEEGNATRFWLTEKRGVGLVRDEVEREITPSEFEVLWPATEGKRIEKTRFVLELSGVGVRELVIDSYGGSLAPLVVLEAEFETIVAAESYVPPLFVTHEVTHDPRFKNAHLATLIAPPAGPGSLRS